MSTLDLDIELIKNSINDCSTLLQNLMSINVLIHTVKNNLNKSIFSLDRKIYNNLNSELMQMKTDSTINNSSNINKIMLSEKNSSDKKNYNNKNDIQNLKSIEMSNDFDIINLENDNLKEINITENDYLDIIEKLSPNLAKYTQIQSKKSFIKYSQINNYKKESQIKKISKQPQIQNQIYSDIIRINEIISKNKIPFSKDNQIFKSQNENVENDQNNKLIENRKNNEQKLLKSSTKSEKSIKISRSNENILNNSIKISDVSNKEIISPNNNDKKYKSKNLNYSKSGTKELSIDLSNIKEKKVQKENKRESKQENNKEIKQKNVDNNFAKTNENKNPFHNQLKTIIQNKIVKKDIDNTMSNNLNQTSANSNSSIEKEISDQSNNQIKNVDNTVEAKENKNPFQNQLKTIILNKMKKIETEKDAHLDPDSCNRQINNRKSSTNSANGQDKETDKIVAIETHETKENEEIKNEFDGNKDISFSNDRAIKESEKEKNQSVVMFKTDSEIIKDFEVNNNRFKQIIFEMNNQPKSLIMVDNNLKIVFQNQIFSTYLFYDKSELMNKEIKSIIANSTSPEQKQKIIEIQDAMNDTDMSCEELGEVIWNFQDKKENLVTFVCRFKLQQFEDETGAIFNNLIIYMDTEQENVHSWSIDPRNVNYLLFLILIAISLLILLFYLPYDIAFGVIETARFNFWLDMAITLVFTVDIVLNFFVAQEDKEKNKFVQDVNIISTNQLKGSLALDVLATVPFDYIFTFVSVNLSILKSIRIFKILKLLKLLRISKQFSFVNNKAQISESEFTKEFQQMFKRHSGFFELMLQNSYILIAAHFYTVLFYYVKDNVVETPQEGSPWVANYWPSLEGLPQHAIYYFLLSESVKTALGLGVLSPTHPLEVTMNLAWMFIGLSLFGQGIGNISSFLNNVQAEELEMLNAVSFFQDLCETNEVDHRIQQMIIKDIEEFQSNYQDRKFYKQGKILTSQVMMQLETALYKDFLDKFNLFSKLSISTVRMIKNQSKVNTGKLKQSQGNIISDIILIVNGKLTMYDSEIKLINEYGPNDIQGMNYFQRFCKIKQNIMLDALYDRNRKGKQKQEKTKNMQEYMDEMSYMRREITEKISQNRGQKLQLRGEGDNIPRFVIEESVKLQIQNTPVSSDDLEQISIPFTLLEEIFLVDQETFFTIWKQNSQQFEVILPEERQLANEAQKKFNRADTPAFLITEKEEVHDINLSMQELAGVCEFSVLIGYSIRDQLQNIDDIGSTNIQANMDLKAINLKINGKMVQLEIIDSEQIKLTRGEVEDTINEDEEAQQFNLKKSMVDVRAIYVKFLTIEE